MAGLRERKKRATRDALHHAGMRLFAEQGFARTTIDQIADAANVSRATVFTYFPSKEDIVFGEGPQAVQALAASLGEDAGQGGAMPTIRAWLRQLAGWIEPDLVLQHRLAREVPAVGARKLQLYREIERAVAGALQRELGPDAELPARLAAAALVGALIVAEDTAAARMEREERPLGEAEIETLLDDAVAFAQAGMSVLACRHDASS